VRSCGGVAEREAAHRRACRQREIGRRSHCPARSRREIEDGEHLPKFITLRGLICKTTKAHKFTDMGFVNFMDVQGTEGYQSVSGFVFLFPAWQVKNKELLEMTYFWQVNYSKLLEMQVKFKSRI
jgi:hypothetical protein